MSDYGQNPYYGGGGGFVPGGSPYGSQGSQGGEKKSRGGNSTIRPVTVKQVLEAAQVHQEADFQIDGVDVGVVLMVGNIYNKSDSATNVTYQVGDGTGYIEVKQWLDSADDEAGKTDGIEQEHFISVMGSIKVYGGKRHISATHIRPITNHDEVFNHLLKAVYVSLTLRNPGGGMNGAVKGGMADDYSAGAVNGVDSSAWASLPHLQKKIMEIVAAEEQDDGMHVSVVSRQVGGGVSGEEVMNAIETLMGDGLLYSTIDDLHVKAA